jgi:methylthioxylose transferase
MSEDPAIARKRERDDLSAWLALVVAGCLATWLAVRAGADLGTASAPFLGRYRIELSAATALAPALAIAVIAIAQRRWFHTAQWRIVLLAAYCGLLSWGCALAFVDGSAGFTRALLSPESYLHDVTAVGDHPLAYLRDFIDIAGERSTASRGHPPGPVLLLWAAQKAGLTNHLVLGLAVTALGALVLPLVLSAVREVCGEAAARSYAPVLILATWAVWMAVSIDALVAAIGAAMVAAGVRATTRHGLRAGGWAFLAGFLLGTGALFSYAAAWLGLCVLCLNFARRRAALNWASGLGALVPVIAAWIAGFNWFDGLVSAHSDFTTRVDPARPMLPWLGISLVALLLATGPALVSSVRKMRNTPGWPFLVGAGAAVVFSLAAGLARGGVEHAWLAFFPWLTIAVVAPERRGGPIPPTPLLLVSVAALTAVVVEAVLATPW